MDALPTATTQATHETHVESVRIPAHRDPEEYLKLLREQERSMQPEGESLAAIRTAQADKRSSHGFRNALAVGVLALSAVIVGGLFLRGPAAPGATAALPSATPAAVQNQTAAAAPIVPMERITTTRDDANVEFYEVKLGDSLSAIAVAHSTTSELLMELNGLPDPDSIVAGTLIKVPALTR